jgi:hypothetical protein
MAKKDKRQLGDVDPYDVDDALGDPDQDEFRRRTFCARVAETIAARQKSSSLVVGIYGEWGEGKSTALNFIEVELGKYEHVVCVRFNPWRFGDEAQLLRSYFETLATALKKSLTRKGRRVVEHLANYGAAAVSAVSVSLSQGAVEVNAGEGVKKLADSASVSLEDHRKRIDEILRNEVKRVVVLVDDIDRLERPEVQAIFRLVKLTADFPYTTYVLAFDDGRVAASIGERYGEGGISAGREFLEKIIQVPLRLPQVDLLTLRDFCSSGINDALSLAKIYLTEEQQQEFAMGYLEGVEARIKTPRQCRRYANALAFSMPILRGEVNPIDMMLVEAMRMFYPDLYNLIRYNPHLVLHSIREGAINTRRRIGENEEAARERKKQTITKALHALSEEEQEAARSLLRVLFPRVGEVFGKSFYGIGAEEQWGREQRVASSLYFNRYFSYTVLAGDISDQQIEEFLRHLEHASIEEIVNTIHHFTTLPPGEKEDDRERRTDRFILKLEQNVKTLSPRQVLHLAIAISHTSILYPRPEDSHRRFLTVFRQAARLVRELLATVPTDEGRLDLAKRLLIEADTLSFALECYYFMTTNKDGRGESDIFDAQEVNELGKLILGRIKENTQPGCEPIYIKFPQDTNYLLKTWVRLTSREEVNGFLLGTLNDEPRRVLELLKHFTNISLGGPLERARFIERNNYDSICEVVDAEAVHNALVSIYGKELNGKNLEKIHRLPESERLAQQFAHVHHEVMSERVTANPTTGTPVTDS